MKSRVSVSVSTPVLRAAEREGRKRGIRSRSGVVEEALRLLVAKAADTEVDASLDEYYGAATPAHAAEERAMVRAFNRSQRKRDLDGEGR